MKSKAPQKGFVLVVVAGTLVILIGFIALGVDTGVLYSARTSAQGVADAAALAGAYTFIDMPGVADHNGTATSHATQVALSNTIMGKAVTAGNVTVTPDWATRKVTVSIQSAQPTYFARAIWGPSANIRVTAVAEASNVTGGTGRGPLKPWFLPNTAYSTNPVCDAACDTSQLLVDPGTGTTTAFGLSKYGQPIVIKPQSPGGALAPGDFLAIRFPGASGASDYRSSISAQLADATYLCTDSVEVESGNMKGPTTQGVDDLIGNPPRFEWVSAGQYRRKADGKIFDMSENIIMTPIFNPCAGGFCPSAKGKNGLPIIGFATFFLEGTTSDGVVGRLVSIGPCTASGSVATGGTVLSLPLRLVRP